MVLPFLDAKLSQLIHLEGSHLGSSNMAARGGAQLGSRKKSIDKGHIYH